jgi:hypothetical protein
MAASRGSGTRGSRRRPAGWARRRPTRGRRRRRWSSCCGGREVTAAVRVRPEKRGGDASDAAGCEGGEAASDKGGRNEGGLAGTTRTRDPSEGRASVREYKIARRAIVALTRFVVAPLLHLEQNWRSSCSCTLTSLDGLRAADSCACVWRPQWLRLRRTSRPRLSPRSCPRCARPTPASGSHARASSRASSSSRARLPCQMPKWERMRRGTGWL